MYTILKVTFHLLHMCAIYYYKLQNNGRTPHVERYTLEPVLHLLVCTSPPPPTSPLHPSPLITTLAFCVCESASFSCDIHSCIFRVHMQAVPYSMRPPLHYFLLCTTSASEYIHVAVNGNILFFSWLSSAPLCEPVWSHFIYPLVC